MLTKQRAEPHLDFELLDLFDVGVTVVDTNLNIKFINKKAIELFDIPPELTKPGINLKEIIRLNAQRGEYGPGDLEVQVRERLNLFVPEQSYNLNRHRPNGTVIQIVGHPITSGGFATTYSDISNLENTKKGLENKNIELIEEIRGKNIALEKDKIAVERENAIRDVVVENTPHGISLIDRDLRLVICNKRFNALLDIPEKLSAPGASLEGVFSYCAKRGDYGKLKNQADIKNRVQQQLEDARKFYPYETRRVLPGGTVLEVVGRPVDTGFVTTYTDVTDLVRFQEVAKETSHNLSEFVETSPVGVGISRLDSGEILLINLSGAKLLGFDNIEDVIGMSSRKSWVSKTQRETFIRRFKKYGTVKSEEVQLITAKGDTFWCYLSWNKIKHDNQDRVLFWIYDITEQKEIQRQLFETEKLASLGALVAGVAHEINTPIGIGVTAITHLQEELCDVEKKLTEETLSKKGLETFFSGSSDTLKIILSNLRSAAHLVNSFKQVSVDQISEEPREILISEYLQAVVESLNPTTKRSNVSVQVDFVEDITVFTYPGAISQIVTNLISNSLIHGYPDDQYGTIKISVSGHAHVGIELKFEDDGIGIPEGILSKVMDPFFTTKRGKGGSGLGMCIVHNIVTQKLKGSINLKSHTGEGLLVYITIPTLNQNVSISNN
ncbi:MAG: PAS-domain containing protein [Halopseudomonas aestusnigri]